MMGHRERLKTGLEYDVVSKKWRKSICKLRNNTRLVKFAKRNINKRNRLAYKHQSNEQVKTMYGKHICIEYSLNFTDF